MANPFAQFDAQPEPNPFAQFDQAEPSVIGRSLNAYADWWKRGGISQYLPEDVQKTLGVNPNASAKETARNIALGFGTGNLGGGATGLMGRLSPQALALSRVPEPFDIPGISGALAQKAIKSAGETLAPSIKYGVSDPAEMMRNINAYPDQPTMPADVAPALQAQTEMLATKMGPAYPIIQKALTERNKTAGPQIVKTLSDTLSSGGDIYSTDQALTAYQKQTAGPLYSRALDNKGPFWNEEVDKLLQRPSLQDALPLAKKIAAEQGQKITVPTYENGKLVGETVAPDWRSWDYIKQGVDAVVDANTNDFGKMTPYGRVANQTRLELLKTLDKANPDYAAARAAYAGPAQAKNALELGQQFRTMEPAELADRLSNMTPSEKQFFLQGATRSLISSVEGTTGNSARVLLKNQAIKNQLRELFPNELAYDAAIGRIEDTNRQVITANQALGNSKTAIRLSAQAAQPKPPEHNVLKNAFETTMALAHAPETAIPVFALRGLQGAYNKFFGPKPISPEVEAATARLLTETDPVKRAAITHAIIRQAIGPQSYGLPGSPVQGMAANLLSGQPSSMLSGNQ